MKIFVSVLLCLFSIAVCKGQNLPANIEKTPVLVELFTSENCGKCPPAERALAFLQNEQPYIQAEIITLAFHVDYLDRLAWKDLFSSPLFTQRQQLYTRKFRLGSEYTPQMIVDGNAQFTGSDLGKASKEIIEAAKSRKTKIEISAKTEEKLLIRISDYSNRETATIFLAIAESGLASDIKNGENSGKILEHSAVVRELKPLGTLDLQKNSTEIEIALVLQKDWKKENLKAVIFIQENKNRKIIGVGQENLFPEQK